MESLQLFGVEVNVLEQEERNRLEEILLVERVKHMKEYENIIVPFYEGEEVMTGDAFLHLMSVFDSEFPRITYEEYDKTLSFLLNGTEILIKNDPVFYELYGLMGRNLWSLSQQLVNDVVKHARSGEEELSRKEEFLLNRLYTLAIDYVSQGTSLLNNDLYFSGEPLLKAQSTDLSLLGHRIRSFANLTVAGKIPVNDEYLTAIENLFQPLIFVQNTLLKDGLFSNRGNLAQFLLEGAMSLNGVAPFKREYLDRGIAFLEVAQGLGGVNPAMLEVARAGYAQTIKLLRPDIE